MLKVKLFLAFIALKNLFCPCHKDSKYGDFHVSHGAYTIKKTGKLDPLINESSGLALADSGRSLWTINDSGGKPDLYKTDMHGKLISVVPVPFVTNEDWEEITKDNDGNIYIGDFGNNSNTRKDLKIYKCNLTSNTIDTISFFYPDQQGFQHPGQFRNFDCEAFFWLCDSLYLFSKNRGNKNVHVYKLPARKGKYEAVLKQVLYINSMVTGAAVHAETGECALITYGKLYFFKTGTCGNISFQPLLCRKFLRSGQAEGIVYKDAHTLMLSNEGGALFTAGKRK
jgi:hypothetical protein